MAKTLDSGDSRRGLGLLDARRVFFKTVAIIAFLSLSAMLVSGGHITVTWTFPDENEGGSPLTDLAGARLYYGLSRGQYTDFIDVPGGEPGETRDYTLTGLTAGATYYLNGTAYNTAGLEGELSEDVVRVALSDVQATSTARPPFTWPALAGATYYQLWINRDGATYSTPWLQGVTTWTPPSDLSAGRYSWWVRGWWPVTGYSAWSSRTDFTVASMVPGLIAQIAPTGSQGDSNPTFRWAKDAKATWYRVWVSHPGGGIWHDKWYAMTGTGEGIATVNGHPGGSSTWWIQGWGPDGTGPWAGPMAFSTPDPAPAKPTLTAPLGTVTSPVTFQYASARAEWYRIYVSRSGTKVLDKWTESATYNAGTLGSGTYSWWVAGWNAVSGKTVWSDQGTFTIP